MDRQELERHRKLINLLFIIFIVISISGVTFYFAFWRIPDNTEQIDGIMKEWQVEKARLSKIPQEKNAWKDYEEAVKIMETAEQKNQGRFSAFDYWNIWEKCEGMTKEEIKKIVSESVPLNREILSYIDDGFGKEFGVSTTRLIYNPLMMHFYPIERLTGYTLLSGIDCENNHKPLSAAKRYLQSIHIANGWRVYVGYNYRNVDNCTYSIKRLTGLLKKEKDNRDLAEYVLKESGRISDNWTTFKSDIIWWLWKNRNYKFYFSEEAGYHCHDRYGAEMKFSLAIYSRQLMYMNNILLHYYDYCQKPYPVAIALIDKEPIPNFPYIKESLKEFNYCLKSSYRDSIETGTRFDGMRITAALNLYRLDNGGYPENLDSLAPKYLGEVPKDSFAPDGKFVYKRKGNDDFILYSVGEDMRDDDRALVEKGSTDRRDIMIVE